jgi:hypothetical protein
MSMKKIRKIPFQMYLDPDQEKVVEHLSQSRGKSKAFIIRLCISRYIESLPSEKDPAMELINLGDSGKKDISRRHDDYLASMA